MLCWLGYLWPWPLTLIFYLEFSRSDCMYLGNGKPDCHGKKGTGVDRMPWCETLRIWVNRMLHWLGYRWHWPLTLNFSRSNCISGMGSPIVMERRGRGSIGCPWCETPRKWVNRTLRWLGYLWPWLWPWIFMVKLYLGNGKPDGHGTKGTGVDRMPWCETQPLCDFEAEDIVRDRGDLRCRRFRRRV